MLQLELQRPPADQFEAPKTKKTVIHTGELARLLCSRPSTAQWTVQGSIIPVEETDALFAAHKGNASLQHKGKNSNENLILGAT